MQIDSHMRFAPGWDDELLDALVACDSPQPVLTTYPLQYELATREVRLRHHPLVCRHRGLRQLHREAGLVTVRRDRRDISPPWNHHRHMATLGRMTATLYSDAGGDPVFCLGLHPPLLRPGDDGTCIPHVACNMGALRPGCHHRTPHRLDLFTLTARLYSFFVGIWWPCCRCWITRASLWASWASRGTPQCRHWQRARRGRR
jgi:hypothetical protein